MKKYYLYGIKYLVIISILLCLSCKVKKFENFIASGNYNGTYWPTNGWRSCSPEEVNMDSDQLYRVYEYVSEPERATLGIIIIKDGYIIAEEYFRGNNQNNRFESYSVAKSFLSALVGIAIQEGYINSINDYAHQYFEEWQGEDIAQRKKMITIYHLLAMISGISFNENYSDPNNDIIRMASSGNYLNYMLNQPMQYEPARYWQYRTGNSILLSGIIQRSTGENTFSFGMDRMFRAIGIDQIYWENDDNGLTIGGWGVNATLREYAKFGYLYLNNGRWDGQQIIFEEWITQSIQPISENIDFYGLHWWLISGFDGFEESGLPQGICAAIGIHGQVLYVIPSANIVIVKTANTENPLDESWDHIHFLNLILESL